jgi:exopolysaccharide biosynthesis WecB/TagA/CpsF family protein
MMIWNDTTSGAAAVTVTVPHKAALLDDMAARLAAGTGFAVATLNLDHVVKLRRDPAFQAAYLRQTHVTADGNPIVWLSRLAGQSEITLIPGSELVEPATAIAARMGYPVALFGATETSLQGAAMALQAKYPALRVVLTLAPPMGFDPEGAAADAAIAQIGDSGARLVFLALGAPKQERFAARALAALPATGFLSIGAGLDFLSGAQRRAPRWARALAAEWLWRMAMNPRRLAIRYGACLLALPGLTGRALRARRRAAP